MNRNSEFDRRAAHQQALRQTYQQNKAILEEQLHLQVDPRDATRYVFEIKLTDLKLAKATISVDNNPEDVLKALEQTEAWYISRDNEYPYPKWLAEQRDFWQKKLAGQE